jgi:CBS domain-containing protein
MQMLLDRAEATTGLLVRDIMCSSVIRITPDASARQCAALLAYYGLTSVPVVERMGRVVGIVAASDILHLRMRETPERSGSEAGEPTPRFETDTLDSYTVGEIMLPVLFSIAPSASLADLARLFEQTGAERVVVAEDERLAGIVTTTDLLCALAGATRAICR